MHSPSLTHWGRDKMDAISQTIFSSAFSGMEMFEFRLKFHWSLFLRVQLTIFQHWFRKWLGAVQTTSHYLNQWWLDYQRIYASLGLNELNTKFLDTRHWLIIRSPWSHLPMLKSCLLASSFPITADLILVTKGQDCSWPSDEDYLLFNVLLVTWSHLSTWHMTPC